MNWIKKHLSKNSVKFLFVLAVLMCIFLVSADYGCMLQDLFIGDDDWPMFKFNVERTGASSSFDFNTIYQLWRYDYGLSEQGGGSRVSPAVSSDRVVIPTRHFINCFDTDDGELMWMQYIGDNYSSPVIYQGNVIISSFNAIYSFDLKSGSPIWNKSLTKEKEYISAGASVPAVFDGKIYCGLRGKDDTEGYLYCIDAGDGATIWRYQTNGTVQTSPIVTSGKVIFGSDDRNVHCLDAGSGDNIWTFYTKGTVRSSPAVYGDRVFIGSNDANVYCLDVESGNLVWNCRTDDKVTATPTISDGKLFVSSNDKYVYCLNIDDGKLLWRYRIGNSTYTSPTVCGAKILLGFESGIHCLNTQDGSLVWSVKLDDVGSSTPLAIHDKKLFFRTAKFVYCFVLN
jgi:outer membrane protein assembly factor BamB